jgi:hypothetical protein
MAGTDDLDKRLIQAFRHWVISEIHHKRHQSLNVLTAGGRLSHLICISGRGLFAYSPRYLRRAQPREHESMVMVLLLFPGGVERVAGRQSNSPGCPGNVGAKGCARMVAQKKFLYSGILSQSIHSARGRPPNKFVKAEHVMSGVSEAQSASALVSSNSVRPAPLRIVCVSIGV